MQDSGQADDLRNAPNGARGAVGALVFFITMTPMPGKISPHDALVLLKAAFVAARTSSPMLRPRAIRTVVECAKDVGRAMRASGLPAERAVIEVKNAARLTDDTGHDVAIMDQAVTAVIQGVYESNDK